ncbi:hypothetical protein D5086_016486 [Populus alba]|uniref:Uncharacterized protein n=1 Tax=Populus alba TaxID=43335 RepID=A0ACC4BUG8_POPAL
MFLPCEGPPCQYLILRCSSDDSFLKLQSQIRSLSLENQPSCGSEEMLWVSCVPASLNEFLEHFTYPPQPEISNFNIMMHEPRAFQVVVGPMN